MVTMVQNRDEEEIRELLPDIGLTEDDLFDRSSDLSYEDQKREGLTGELAILADKIKPFLRGNMLVKGQPGSGKGLWGHTLAYLVKACYEGRKALLDHKPRSLFGLYLPFDEEFIYGELQKIWEQSKFKGEMPEEIDKDDKKRHRDISKVAQRWMFSNEGETYLKGAVILLEEFKRYVNKRRPHNPMLITLSNLMTWWRHFNFLLIGMSPFEEEIDRFQILPYITHTVSCEWTLDATAACTVRQTHWVNSLGVLNFTGRATRIYLDGWLARDWLGGKRLFDIYNSQFLPSMRTAQVRM